MDPNFCESVWGLLDALVNAQRVHVVEPKFSKKKVNAQLKSTRNWNYHHRGLAVFQSVWLPQNGGFMALSQH